MGFTNFGNFGKKLSDFNSQRREKNLEKLRIKTQNAKVEGKRLQEEKVLRKTLEKHEKLKSEVKEQRNVKINGFIKKVQKVGDKYQNKEKKKDFDILGNNKSKKKTPELFGKPGKSKFKF